MKNGSRGLTFGTYVELVTMLKKISLIPNRPTTQRFGFATCLQCLCALHTDSVICCPQRVMTWVCRSQTGLWPRTETDFISSQAWIGMVRVGSPWIFNVHVDL